jgi:zinc transport system substrate-binding protein
MINRLAVVIIFVCMAVLILPPVSRAATGERHMLVTTFPIYQIVRNVTKGRSGVKVDLMLSSQIGCPHDYALTPQDMQKLSSADILVVNGLGMEDFVSAPVSNTNPRIIIVDSSLGVDGTLTYDSGHEHEEHGAHGPHHDHDGVNPHLFASPRMSAKIALSIATQLSKHDPQGAALYNMNAVAYADAMNKLADEMSGVVRGIKNNRIVEPHGVFDYLARDIGLEVVAVMQPHGQEPSAAEMMDLVGAIKSKKAGAIFTEPQYPDKTGKVLSKETGVPTAILDPVATGPEDASLDYYESAMRHNMKILESTLGVR